MHSIELYRAATFRGCIIIFLDADCLSYNMVWATISLLPASRPPSQPSGGGGGLSSWNTARDPAIEGIQPASLDEPATGWYDTTVECQRQTSVCGELVCTVDPWLIVDIILSRLMILLKSSSNLWRKRGTENRVRGRVGNGMNVEGTGGDGVSVDFVEEVMGTHYRPRAAL